MPAVRSAVGLCLLVGIIIATIGGRDSAQALPEAGTDVLEVSAEADVTSLLGSETITFEGTVTVERSDPSIDGAVEVVDTEIVAIELEGSSMTGPVLVRESPSRTSSGEIRSLQPPPDQFPASSFFDVFIEVEVPASPQPALTLHNNEPFHLVPTSGGPEVAIDVWPPIGVSYEAEPEPCIELLPTLPAEVCVTRISVLIEGAQPTATPTPTATNTPQPPSPTPTQTATPTSTATPTAPTVVALPSVGAGRPNSSRPLVSEVAAILGLMSLTSTLLGGIVFGRRPR